MSTMSRILRLSSRCQFGMVHKQNNWLINEIIRPVSLRVEQAKPIPLSNHDEKNMQLHRPMSPHLTIYAPESQSFMSITHRMTGAAMTGYLMAFGIGTLVLPQDISVYLSAIDAMNLPYPVLFAARFLMVLPFTYHGINGVRHLIWDMGKGLYIKQVIVTGYMILAIAIILAASLAS